MRVKAILDKFGKEVVQQSRTRLTKGGKNTSKTLYNSLSYKAKESKNSFQFDLFAADYWEFVDAGVKGVGGTKTDGSQWKKKKVTNNKFSYKKDKPPTKAFDKWVVRRGIAPRNKKGQFVSRQSLLFAISNSVYHTGLETTEFLTKSFNIAFKKLPDDIVEAYGLEQEQLLELSFKQ